MRIALDGNLIQEELNGVSRYTFNLASALATTVLAQDELFLLYEPGEPRGSYRIEDLVQHERVMLRPAAGLSKATGQVALANALRAIGADVYHSPYRLFSVLTNVPTVITIHELALLHGDDRRSRWTGRLSQFTQQAQLTVTRRADAIICVSEFLRQEYLKVVDVAPARVHVVYNGVDHSRFHPRYRPEARQRAARLLGIEPPYVLALASAEPRKNLRTLIQAYARLPEDMPRLVLAGAGNWGQGPIYEMVREAGIEQRVRFTGYVPEAVLPDLYGGARCFVFPSLYEGFGLPVLEALACGAPVVASDRTSIPEVTGDAAILVDPTNVAALAEGMHRVLANKALRDALRAKAPGQAARFSWQRTARETRRVYEAVLEKE
ncbi:MAG: glycosyltransferase family 4 protein [Ardenticatenaceae bacterium]